MRKKQNENGLFVDAALLRDHVSKLRQQERLSMELYDMVAEMTYQDDAVLSNACRPILSDIKQLSEYFRTMSQVLAEVEDEAIHLSLKLGYMLEEDTAEANREISSTIML